MSTVRLLLAATIVVIAAAACDANGHEPDAAGVADSYSRDGPAVVPYKHGYYTQLPRGTLFTDGWEKIELTGHRSGVLESVALTGAHGLTLDDVVVAGPQRKIGSIQMTKSFPPTSPELGTLRPAEGASLKPGRIGTNLSLGIRVVSGDYGFRTGVEVRYRVGEKKYVINYPAILMVCSPSIPKRVCSAHFDRVFEAARMSDTGGSASEPGVPGTSVSAPG